METSTIPLQGKVQNPTIRRKTNAYRVLGITWPSTGTCSGEGKTVNSERYSEMPTDRLKPAIPSKHRGLLSKDVLFHDNSRPQNAAHTAETLRILKFQVMVHPPYSPAFDQFDVDSPRTKKRRTRYMRGSLLSPKPYFRRTPGSLCNDGPSALKSKGTMLKMVLM